MTPEERAKQIADHSTYGWLREHQSQSKNKPIHKFNGGKGATLCHGCNIIIKAKLTNDLYCKKCLTKKLKALLLRKT